jgi:predicted  nucleic acid-binding Zn-ribbon protein
MFYFFVLPKHSVKVGEMQESIKKEREEWNKKEKGLLNQLADATLEKEKILEIINNEMERYRHLENSLKEAQVSHLQEIAKKDEHFQQLVIEKETVAKSYESLKISMMKLLKLERRRQRKGKTLKVKESEKRNMG